MEHTVEIYADNELRLRYDATDPPVIQVGDELIVERDVHVVLNVEHELSTTAQITRIRTSRNPLPGKMPGDAAITTFLRYHVLIRVFDGDITKWLRITSNATDLAFLRSLQVGVRRNPQLLKTIRTTVDASGLWPAPPSN